MSHQVMQAHASPRASIGVIEQPPSTHNFLPPGDEMRSPCPCLNTLSNHSYLPHDGRNITFHKLVSALENGIGLSKGFALFLAVGSFILLRRPTLAPFNLHDIARHNFIEHNASVVHDDARPGDEFAPSSVDPQLLKEFLDMAHPSSESLGKASEGNVINGHDVAACRVKREAVSFPVDALHAELARGEFAIVMGIFGTGMDSEMDQARLDIFLRENRIPDGWTPSHTMHLWEAVAKSAGIRQAMNEIREKAIVEDVRQHDSDVLEWFESLVKKILDH